MKHRRFPALLLTLPSLPLLLSCHISDRGMDFSPVTERFEAAEDDDVILDGDSRSISAPLAVTPAIPAPVPAPAAKPTPAPTPENPFVASETPAAPPQTVKIEPALKPALTVKPAAPAAKPAARSAGTYTVVSGDTLNKLARRYGTTPAALAAANGMSPTAGLRIGQKLVIPQAAATATAKTSGFSLWSKKAPQTTATSGKTTRYTVQQGDTLYRIAARHGVTPAALMKANGLTPETAGKIKLGSTLTIPAK